MYTITYPLTYPVKTSYYAMENGYWVTGNSNYPNLAYGSSSSDDRKNSAIIFNTPSGVTNCDKLIFSCYNCIVTYYNTLDDNEYIIFNYRLYEGSTITTNSGSISGEKLLTSGTHTINVNGGGIDYGTYGIAYPTFEDIVIDISNLGLVANTSYILVFEHYSSTINPYYVNFSDELPGIGWDLTLNAQNTVTYDANGGNSISEYTLFGTNGFIVTSTIPTKNNTSENSNFTITGVGGDSDIVATATKTITYSYIFLGWSTDSTAASATYTSGQTVTDFTSDITLYAVWKTNVSDTTYSNNTIAALSIPEKSNTSVTYTVILDTDGGTASSTSLSCVRNSSYLFNQWTTESGTPISTTHSFTIDTVIYASWYITRTGSVALPISKKSGYIFLGWSIVKESTDYVSENYEPDFNITLYANYKKGYLVEMCIYTSNKWLHISQDSSFIYHNNNWCNVIANLYSGEVFNECVNPI